MTDKRTLYVNRPLLNADEFKTWAKGQGFGTVLDDPHVTIAFSKTPLTWPDGIPDGFDREEASFGPRSVERLGDDGAVVLRFESPDLEKRWAEIKAAGASWDHEGYKPHITISYTPGDLDLAAVEPFGGTLEFGPESWAEITPKEKRSMAEDGFYFLAADSETPVGPFPSREVASRASALLSLPLPSGLAFDKETTRVYDADGRLRVNQAPISKACVNPYLGSEIPNAEELGLVPTQVYMLFRDPEELRKAAPTFNGLPILVKHVAVSADDPQKDIVGGCTGSTAFFEDPYLYNALSVWTRDAIEGIETDQQKELSSAYRYRADMTPGAWEGVKYDGVMRDIVGNHVALVKKGRAGPDVVVGDEAMPQQEENEMSKKVTPVSRAALGVSAALMALYAPKLAMDKKPDYASITKGVTLKSLLAQDGKSIDQKKLAAVVKIARDALDPMMTPEATAAGGVGPDDIIMKLLDQVVAPGGAPPAVEADAMIPQAAMPNAAASPGGTTEAATGTDDNAELTAFLATLGLPPEVVAKIMSMCGGGEAAPAAAAVEGGDPDTTADDEDPNKEKDKDMVTKPAMDAAIKAATEATEKRVRETQKSIHEAVAFVKPWVGDVSSLAFDSAEGVYRGALASLGVKAEDVTDPAALKHIVQAQPKPGARRQGAEPIALDAAAATSFAERFPHAAHIGNLG